MKYAAYQETTTLVILATWVLVSGCASQQMTGSKPQVVIASPSEQSAHRVGQPSGAEPVATIRTVAFETVPEAAPSPTIAQPADELAFEIDTIHAAPAAMTLDEIESIALSNNPTIRELAATTQKAAGYRTQVGLRANPVVGYQAMQLADEGTDQHTAFVEQEFVTADKLALNRRVLNEALRSQLLELEAQKLRVTTDVRIKFYEVLAVQQRMHLISAFQSVTDKGMELAELRLEALEGSRADLLQSKVQKSEVDLSLRQAEVTLAASWRELAAVMGMPELPLATLVGSLPSDAETRDWAQLTSSILTSSPEYQAAQVRISRALANLRRQGVQAVPNLTVQLATGVDNATDSGLINLQVGAPLPVFNQNQGNLAAARAEYCRAVMEAKRIENAIQARLATVSGEFDSAAVAVEEYSQEILPSAQESLDLAEQAYRAGETSFVQVLIARRMYFDSNLQFLRAQQQLAQARARIDGYVLSGSLEPVPDQSGDDGLRGLTFSQQ